MRQILRNYHFLDHIVATFTVGDFNFLLSRSNMLQLIAFSLLFGISTALVGEKARPVASFLSAATAVMMMKMVSIIMYYAGFPPETLPIIAVISTIIDAPATLLNSTGNTVCAMLVTRLVEGKNWLDRSFKSEELGA